ncbi:MAG: ubiquinone/menaquinone biosynthesis methyltransferase [Candidatus Eisenbacteria bacterium]|uniref:Ubiquinone/menaquinone biosynthesis methyltransferase n=1 Tax=Eiseniibacteriota bacterium TaxID=2212470 RepID=A0A849SVB4_UNCEI|nr:ubiquinone/menaquinone biosynthesis methyltransferase [Candidatus Eisenbacteria bacterium]
MPSTDDPTHQSRFAPQASRAMAGMFDDVSGRYDLLNRLMTLGQDGAWRAAMWREVPEEARVVLDLCTGSGVSLPGLRRAGRTVIGMDVSLRMLEHAQDAYGGAGWAPRFACADGFRLPVRDQALSAITIAFGIRNLRPRPLAIAELARVLEPDGTLVILEAAAPRGGAFAPVHAAHLRHVVPALGRLSPDPSAYRYLSDSIFEFGDGTEFERELEAAGFRITTRRSFLLGATRLWTARRSGPALELGHGGQESASSAPAPVHLAMGRAGFAQRSLAERADRDAEAAAWALSQTLVSAALTFALVWGGREFAKSAALLPLSPSHRPLVWLLIGVGVIAFGARTCLLGLRLLRLSARE